MWGWNWSGAWKRDCEFKAGDNVGLSKQRPEKSVRKGMRTVDMNVGS